jgi:hypothetical protein
MIYGLLKRFLKATSTGTKEKVAKTMIFWSELDTNRVLTFVTLIYINTSDYLKMKWFNESILPGNRFLPCKGEHFDVQCKSEIS